MPCIYFANFHKCSARTEIFEDKAEMKLSRDTLIQGHRTMLHFYFIFLPFRKKCLHKIEMICTKGLSHKGTST